MTVKQIARVLTACWLSLVVSTTLFAQQDPPATGSEADLIAVLQSDAPMFDKAKACQQLAVIGTKDSVPVLAKFLSDEKMAHYARFALESNPDPSVDAALRAALDSLEGERLVGVINSIGMRRDAEAVGKLKTLLDGTDPAVAAAAAAALGRIATDGSIELLIGALEKPEPLRVAVADACLTAGDTLAQHGKTSAAVKVFEAVRQADVPQYQQLAALSESIRTQGENAVPLLVEQLQSDDDDRFAVGLSMAHRIQNDRVAQALISELKKPYASSAEHGKELVIIDAKYGADDKWVDVTDQLLSNMEADGITVEANNSLAGDPAPQSKKVLRLRYTLGGEPKQAEIAEGKSLVLEGSPPQNSRHARIIAALEKRGDKIALPAILDAARNGPWDVKLPAVKALATLGDASAVELLLETALADQGALSQAALSSLANISDDEADQRILARLRDSDGQARQKLITLAGLREIASAVPILKKLAGSEDPEVAQAAVDALGLTVDLDEFPTLVGMLAKSTSADAAVAAKTALQKACQRMPDRDAASTILLEHMKGASYDTKADLLDLLGVTGGERALAGVAAAARSDDEQMVDAATQVLGKWMSVDAAPVLLELAKSGNPKFRVRALRGYIRIPRQLNATPEQKLVMSNNALETATRDQERILVIKDVLATIPTAESLHLVMQHIDSPALQAEASAAAVAIGRKLVKTNPKAVAAAMPKVIEVAKVRSVAAAARRLLRQAQQ